MKWAIHSLTVGLVVLTACSNPEDGGPPSDGIPAIAEQPRAQETIDRPPLERVDDTVREQIRQAEAALDALGDDAAPGRRADAWGALGMLYDTYGFSEAAASSYRIARRLDPQDFRWHYYLGRLARAAGRLSEADDALTAALTVSDSEPAALGELGLLRLDQRRFDEALDVARRLAAQDPSSVAGPLLQAQTAFESGDWRAAIDAYERVLEAQPGASRLRRPLAQAYRAVGDEDEARAQAARAGVGRPDLPDPWARALDELRIGVQRELAEALTLYRQQRFEEAAAAYRSALEKDPDHALARANLGAALKELGRLEEARSELEAALRLDPSQARAAYNLGVVLATAGDDEAAIALYNRALDSNPRYVEARYNRANALLRTGKSEAALEDYSRLVEENPGNGSAHLGRALALLRSGREVAAATALEESDRTFPNSPTFKNLLARLLAVAEDEAIRDPQRALELARTVARGAPSLEHFETLALAQAAGGDHAGAVETLTAVVEALQRTADDDRAAQHLERVEASLSAYREGRLPPSDLGGGS